ncbi:MAG: hypothetical protein K2X73_00855 [Sphingomonas sp.]|jgi:hypothetical protein|nr:hypothetical protein [Sphingomonas sp.]
MGMFDGLLAQLGPDFDLANLGTKLGLSKEQVEQAVQALGVAHPQPGDTVQAAAAQTGLAPDVLQQIVGHIGGEGSLGRFAQMLQEQGGGVMGMLDRDGDGNPLNDIAGLAGGLFGGKN